MAEAEPLAGYRMGGWSRLWGDIPLTAMTRTRPLSRANGQDQIRLIPASSMITRMTGQLLNER